MSLRKPIEFETAFATYTGTEIVGEGGAGRVYKVTDESGRVYAVKLLDPAKATRAKRKRFKNELLFGQLNKHANIISVIDSGVHQHGKQSAPFYVMPYYEGSLRKLLAKSIPKEKVLFYFTQLLNGVEAAHLKGVVHRDLKPENVLHDMSADVLLIADFGIARFEEEELFTAVETAAHDRLANFLYAAPEQRMRGANVDRTADIYALGLILNEMFTGHVPFGTDYTTIANVAPEYVYLDEIAAAMLRQTPERRPSSIDEIKNQLEAAKGEFVVRQRISQIDQTVIPATDLDDPLVVDPPRLVSVDYENGTLHLKLNRAVNEEWKSEFTNLRSNYSAIWGKGPEAFGVRGDVASVTARENQAQEVVNHFKNWLTIANRQYEHRLRTQKEDAERRRTSELQRQKEEEETRLRLLKNIRI